MKKTKLELLALVANWASRAAALEKAGVDIAYDCGISSTPYYTSFKFKLDDLLFDSYAEETSTNEIAKEIEKRLTELSEQAIADLQAKAEEIQNALSILQ